MDTFLRQFLLWRCRILDDVKFMVFYDGRQTRENLRKSGEVDLVRLLFYVLREDVLVKMKRVIESFVVGVEGFAAYL